MHQDVSSTSTSAERKFNKNLLPQTPVHGTSPRADRNRASFTGVLEESVGRAADGL
jgi:hypothetical protein